MARIYLLGVAAKIQNKREAYIYTNTTKTNDRTTKITFSR